MFPTAYHTDPQPDNVVSLTKLDDDFSITGIFRKNLNRFPGFGNTDRLPDIALDVKQQQIFDWPVYLQAESSVARLKREFENV